MNRIYQGRVSKVEIHQPGASGRSAEYEPLTADAKAAPPAGEKLLREHHRRFPDAGAEHPAAATLRRNGRSSTFQSRVPAPAPALLDFGKSSYVASPRHYSV